MQTNNPEKHVESTVVRHTQPLPIFLYRQEVKREMKITVEHYDEKVSIETKHEDLSLDEFMELVRKVAHSVGYGDKTIAEWFNPQEK